MFSSLKMTTTGGYSGPGHLVVATDGGLGRTGQAARSLPLLQHWSGRFLYTKTATAPPAQLGATHWGRLIHFAPAELLHNYHN